MVFTILAPHVSFFLLQNQNILVRKTIITHSQSKSMSSDKSPVSKAELINILTKLVSYLESMNKQKRGASTVKSLRDLIKGGYLPSDTQLAGNGRDVVPRDLLTASIAAILVRHNEKIVPITPDSRRASPIPHPSESSGS